MRNRSEAEERLTKILSIIFTNKKGCVFMMNIFIWLNSHFYGEHWYIYWGIIAALIIFSFCVHLPKFVKSIKEAKKRGEK